MIIFYFLVILPNYISNRATAFFDITFIAVGAYIFMNIFTAIMYNQFRGYLFVSALSSILANKKNFTFVPTFINF